MPALAWFHAQLWCYGQWLPGDGRGFRSDEHRIHSSGDYKNPPPPGEHAGLHRYSQQIMTQAAVTFAPPLRTVAGEAVVRWFSTHEPLRLLALSVGGKHGHLLCLLEREQVDALLGRVKKYASQRLRVVDRHMPRHIYAIGGEPKLIGDRDHFRRVFHYVLDHANEGHWTWSAGEAVMEEAGREWFA